MKLTKKSLFTNKVIKCMENFQQIFLGNYLLDIINLLAYRAILHNELPQASSCIAYFILRLNKIKSFEKNNLFGYHDSYKKINLQRK